MHLHSLIVAKISVSQQCVRERPEVDWLFLPAQRHGRHQISTSRSFSLQLYSLFEGKHIGRESLISADFSAFRVKIRLPDRSLNAGVVDAERIEKAALGDLSVYNR